MRRIVILLMFVPVILFGSAMQTTQTAPAQGMAGVDDELSHEA